MAKANLLIVDDNLEILDIYRTYFADDFNLSIFSDPKMIEKSDFLNCDLIITDFNMPNKNGVELIEDMYCLGIEKPVLMITGYLDQVRDFKSFTNIIVTTSKPIEPDTTLEMIELLTDYSKSIRKLEEAFLKNIHSSEKVDSNDFLSMRSVKNVKLMKTKVQIKSLVKDSKLKIAI